MKSGALWVHCLGLALADIGRDLRSSESRRTRRILFFCQVSKARFYRFPVGQISRNLKTTRRSVWRWILSEQDFENFLVRVAFQKNAINWGWPQSNFIKTFSQKTRVPALLCGVICVILRLAILVQYRLVTDRQTDRGTNRHRATAHTAPA